MNETKYTEIRKKCIEANPALLALTFGCEVKTADGKGIVIVNATPNIKIEYEETGDWAKEKDIIEILGHEPSLSDVLLSTEPHTYFVDTQGGWWKWNKSGIDPEFLGKGSDWNLLKPSLRDNPQCWDFLFDLLCGK